MVRQKRKETEGADDQRLPSLDTPQVGDASCEAVGLVTPSFHVSSLELAQEGDV